MELKTVLYISFLLSLLAACTQGEDTAKYAITVECWTEQASAKTELAEDDTVNVDLFEKCKLFVKGYRDTVVFAYNKEYLSVEQVPDSGYYLCTPRASGIASIVFLSYSYDEDNSPLSRVLPFKINGHLQKYAASNTKCTIEGVDSWIVTQEIYQKLLDRIPQGGSAFVLNYTSMVGGTFTYQKDDYESGTSCTAIGTFTVTGNKAYYLTCSEWELSFILSPVAGESYYLLEQDVTEEFRQLYPQAGIERITKTLRITEVSPG